MLEVSAMASKIGAIMATILYAFTLLGQVDRLVINHLGETFASKADVQLVKEDVAGVSRKIDTVLARVVENGRQ